MRTLNWLSDPNDVLLRSIGFHGISGAYTFMWVFMYVPRILFLVYLIKWLFLNRKNDTDASRRKLTHAFTFNFLAHTMTIVGVYLL